ncbi:4-hydroxythreonine-4-phosphate dehydrogenase PdxA [Propylenella binzhouense]|uniref:4-hydroxythreonine-4-phosphate dehydrogenase n=1 Tax=Propylenella binzhouense TaxID=2555902 RepID=A0A964WVA2_9HYPH|nr:4-hydroxythreonine-4-phosphate dehydrogenase PdxA [Propylenella binzhouense]
MSAAAAGPVALTLGEPAGIAPEITIKAWLRRAEERIPPFLFIGDGDLLRRRAAAIGIDLPVAETDADGAAEAFPRALPCLADAPRVRGEPGRITSADEPAVVNSITTAVDLVRAGAASAVATNPIQKRALADIGFRHPGHTEYLGELAETRFGAKARPVMMLAGPELRVVPVTVHVPLRTVPGLLTTDLIVETARIVARDLARRFGMARPRLAIAGLNPHAGEEGLLGSEDSEIVRPAVEVLRAEGIDARGPLPADTMFHAAARAGYDAALCMYHDQALIPIKTLAFDEAVNVTLGLPYIRTSPDHGTALDLAGTDAPRPASLVAALKLAAEMAARERVP